MASPTSPRASGRVAIPTCSPWCWPYKEAYYADLAAREKKSWDDAQAAKDAFDKQKADELAELIAWQDAERAQRAFDRAERYAQIDVARDAEIQLLIAEAEADDAQVITPERRASILEAMREYAGPMNRRGTYPKGPFMGLRGKAKRELWDAR